MRSLEERIDIDAPHGVVWGILDDFSGVATWAPYLRSSAPVGDQTTGVGSYRVMQHFWGFRLEESVIEWEEGRGYAFTAVKVPYPIRDVRESWQMDAGPGGVTVTTRVEYDMHLGPLGSALDAVLVSHLVRREMRGGLRGLKKYAETVAAESSRVAREAAIA
jgi:ligand-binding SRPBCC domain-containing protein